jgi:GNAT superfamily N-acetyltransferase
MSTLDMRAAIPHVPDAPSIPGLTFRPFRDEQDFDRIVDLQNACHRVDGVDWLWVAEDLRNFMMNMANFDLRRDLLLAEVDARLIGYLRVLWNAEAGNNRQYFLTGNVLPELRRHGIGRALLHWGEQRARAIDSRDRSVGQHSFEVSAEEGAVGRHALLQREGYRPVRYSNRMVRPLDEPLPDALLPAGLEVRPVLPEHYRQIWEAINEAFQDHWGWTPSDEGQFQAWLGWSLFAPPLWRVAWDGEEVAETVINVVDEAENQVYRRQRGMLYSIAVRLP